MWLGRSIAVAAMTATIGGLALGTSATAQTTCDWYARTSLEQQKLNIDRKCGFTGPEWNSDRTRHLQWCSGVAPDQWKRSAQLREQALATKCGTGAK